MLIWVVPRRQVSMGEVQVYISAARTSGASACLHSSDPYVQKLVRGRMRIQVQHREARLRDYIKL